MNTDRIHHADELEIWYTLQRLELEHWHDVDFDGGRHAHEFYCDDGVFAVGNNRFEGRDGISSFYEWRRHQREMTTRHVVTNHIFHSQHNGRAYTSGLIMVHRGRGRPPFRMATAPILVADFAGEWVPWNGEWRYALHTLFPVFVDEDAPPSLAIDPRFLAHARADAAGNDSAPAAS